MAHKKSDKNTDVVHEGEVVVTKGRGGNANFPASRKGLVKTDEDRKLVSKIIPGWLLSDDAYETC